MEYGWMGKSFFKLALSDNTRLSLPVGNQSGNEKSCMEGRRSRQLRAASAQLYVLHRQRSPLSEKKAPLLFKLCFNSCDAALVTKAHSKRHRNHCEVRGGGEGVISFS